MKVDIYKNYSKVFDYFYTDGRIFPLGFKFIRGVAELVNPNDRVLDIGGGTGFFTGHLLLWKPDINITFIEPVPDMMVIAKKRLPSSCIFINETYSNTYTSIKNKFNVIILMRSLYSLYEFRNKYNKIFLEIYNLLEKNGYICIMDFTGQVHHTSKWKEKCKTIKINSIKDEQKFENNWSILQNAIREFNNGIQSGVYHTFNKNELHSMLSNEGFSKVSYKNYNYCYICFYQKQK